MTEKKLHEALPHGRISYPEFSSEDAREDAACRRMNDFYRALRDGAAAFIETLSGASCFYTADYVKRPGEDGTLIVEYTLRLRRRGRTEAQKKFCHRWRDGVLIPEEKKRRKGARRSFRARS